MPGLLMLPRLLRLRQCFRVAPLPCEAQRWWNSVDGVRLKARPLSALLHSLTAPILRDVLASSCPPRSFSPLIPERVGGVLLESCVEQPYDMMIFGTHIEAVLLFGMPKKKRITPDSLRDSRNLVLTNLQMCVPLHSCVTNVANCCMSLMKSSS